MLLGDRLEDVFKKTGVKALVDMITDDCGCEDRRDALNKFHSKWLAKRGRNNKANLNIIADTYENITGKKISAKGRRTQCPSCWRHRMETILNSEQYKEALTAPQRLKLNEAIKQTDAVYNMPIEQLSLKELRLKYPDIKSNSKAKFLELIKKSSQQE